SSAVRPSCGAGAARPLLSRSFRSRLLATRHLSDWRSRRKLHGMSESEWKARLGEVSSAVREVHRALVGAARASYEASEGPAGGPGQMLRLLTEHPHFAWLHPMSELIVDLDSLLAQELLPAGTVAAVRLEVDRLTK